MAGEGAGLSIGVLSKVTDYFFDWQSADRQRKWNEMMWEKTNEWNTPSAQMQRMKQAGLNPNLMYGQMESGNADQARPYDREKMKMGDVAATIGAFQQIANMQADELYTKQKTATEVQQTSIAEVKAYREELELRMREMEESWRKHPNVKRGQRNYEAMMDDVKWCKQKERELLEEKLEQNEFITEYMDVGNILNIPGKTGKAISDIINYIMKNRMIKAR